MRDRERSWEMNDLKIPEGTCPNCPYVIWVPDKGKVPRKACTDRIYISRGQGDVAQQINTKGKPKNCEEYLIKKGYL